ncbi:MAG: DUF4160 domain-containing protein [Ignavibacteriae bacterium]|nr:DUF4160 domain-containing protein [Ignavibacteriota bacterium]
MYFYDNIRHKLPHIHIEYGEKKAIITIKDGKILEGKFPRNKLKLVHAWLEIHRDELTADWTLAVSGEKLFKIEPLK